MPVETSKSQLQQIGNYDILVKLAEGGMGSVYKARHRDTGLIVAIKIIPSNTAKNPVLLKRFEQEFQAARLLDHPNVVKAIEYCGTGPSPFLVMEFVEGESLGQRIERVGPFNEEEAMRIIAQVCQGLHRAHKNGLIHRDVKPDNVMLTPDGIAKLTDLGLVKDVEGELNLTRTGRGLGTPHFMAPEQFRNAKNVDVRSDIYSLGATLYMMLTGEVPFGKVGPLDCWMKKIRNDYVPPRELNPKISDRVDWAIRRSMSGDPDKRPNSCREFVEDLHGTSIRPNTANPEGSVPADIWYLVYKDETGEAHTVKGTTDGIRRALKEGLLGDASNVRACRTKQGPFTGLTTYPEFRDLVVEPAALPPVATPAPNNPTPQRQPTPNPQGRWQPHTPTVQAPPFRPDPDAIDLDQRNKGSSRIPQPVFEEHTSSRPKIRFSDRDYGEPRFPWWMWLVILFVALATALTVWFIMK
jgi:eukaryotic-like serine/threonine-protein kinase